MKMIVGLGNPGTKYNFTRHNTGFLALDFYAKVKGLNWEKNEKNGALWLKDGDLVLVKPQTFYNDSGISVSAFAQFYKIPVEQILVVCDDFNLEFGKTRFREKGGVAGNNGMKSVKEKLGTDAFARLRIGTGNATMRKKMGDTDFVLGKFLPEEKEALPEVLQEAVGKIDEFLKR